jgi:hypothetical protein
MLQLDLEYHFGNFHAAADEDQEATGQGIVD